MTDDRGFASRKAPNRQWIILLVFAGWIVWGFGYQTVWQRFTTQLEGTVTSSRDVPETGAPRYATNYVIRGSDGNDQTYVAGPTDGSIERSIPVGAHIRKEWGQLGYEVNGRWIAFPIAFYVATLGVTALLVVAALRSWWQERQ